MYKLLTTAAVILTVATPSIADEWKGAKDLTLDLETIYQNLDGQTQFNALQGQNGELNLFYNEVSQGVTHLTLQVVDQAAVDAAALNGDTLVLNTIVPTLVEGSDFATIDARADDLVNRINYDLFVETAGSTYDVNGGYAVINHNITGDGSNPDKDGNNYGTDQSNGLVGVKVTEVVTSVNAINDGLLDTGLTTDARVDFINEYKDGSGTTKTFNGVDVADFKGTVNELNTAIGTANGSTGTFFGNNDLSGFTSTNVNDFIIPAYNEYNSIGAPTVNQGYTSISDWANGYETVTAEGSQYRYDGAGVATSDGTTISIDGAAVDLTGTLPDGLVKI